MKNLIVVIVMGILILPLGVMAQDHPHNQMNHDKKSMDHKMNHDENAMEQQGDQVMHFDVSADFQKQLNGVYQASLALNSAFVAGDANVAKSKAANMSAKMNAVDMSLLNGDAHMAWMSYMQPINNGLKAINESANLETQRAAYAGVSEGLFKSVKAFGVGETVYYQYCPMKKSSWLSDNKAIENPYYGSMMLTCGSTKEVLN